MSAEVMTQAPGGADERTQVVVRHWGAPIAYAVFAVAAWLMFVVFGRDGESSLVWSKEKDYFTIAPIDMPARLTGVVVAVLLLLAAAGAVAATLRAYKLPMWAHALFGFVFLLGFLVWASAGASLPVTGLLIGAVSLSVPLVFGAMGGIIGERVGVVNVAIEGQLLAGAFMSALVGTVTRSPYAGLLAAMVAGVLVDSCLPSSPSSTSLTRSSSVWC